MSEQPELSSATAPQHAETIATFRAVTAVGSDNDAARILQVYSWNLDQAVSAYLDNPSILQQLEQQPSPPPLAADQHQSQQLPAPSSPSSEPHPPQPNAVTAVQHANGVQPNGLPFPRLPRWIFVIFSPIRFVWSFLSNLTTKLMHLLSGPAFLIDSAPGNTPTRRFVNFYESRYGTTHPDFHDGSYSSALAAATSQLKFLLVYIHSESHRLTPTFCQQVLADPAFLSAANESFVTWAGSITQRDGAAAHQALRAPALPFLAIVSPSQPPSSSANGLSSSSAASSLPRSQFGVLLSVRAGPMLVTGGAQGAVNWLVRVMQRHNQMLDSIRQQRAERESARLLRQQQDEEFARSLEADRRREEESRAQRQRKEEEQQRLQDLEVRRERKREALGAEPDKGPGVASVVVRLPDGKRVGRRFHQDSALEQVFDWAEVNGVDIEKACLVMAFPRKSLRYPEDASVSIGEAGLFPSAMLLLEERADDSDE